MKDLITVALKQGKEVKLFFVDGTELDGIKTNGAYKIFDSSCISVSRHSSPAETIVINLNLVKYFIAS